MTGTESVGGICGCFQPNTVDHSTTRNNTIDRCYNVGKVSIVESGKEKPGAIAGSTVDDPGLEISNCFYLNTSCAQGIGDNTDTDGVEVWDGKNCDSLVDELGDHFVDGEEGPKLKWEE